MEQREENVRERTTPAENSSTAVTADVFAIFQDVIKDLWVAVLVGISVALLAYVGTYLTYHPQYISQTTFVVSCQRKQYGGIRQPEPDSEDGGSIQDRA